MSAIDWGRRGGGSAREGLRSVELSLSFPLEDVSVARPRPAPYPASLDRLRAGRGGQVFLHAPARALLGQSPVARTPPGLFGAPLSRTSPSLRSAAASAAAVDTTSRQVCSVRVQGHCRCRAWLNACWDSVG